MSHTKYSRRVCMPYTCIKLRTIFDISTKARIECPARARSLAELTNDKALQRLSTMDFSFSMINIPWFTNRWSVETLHGKDIFNAMTQDSTIAHVKRLQNGLVENYGPVTAIISLHGKDQELESGVRDNWSCVREEVRRLLRKGLLKSWISISMRGLKWYMLSFSYSSNHKPCQQHMLQLYHLLAESLHDFEW